MDNFDSGIPNYKGFEPVFDNKSKVLIMGSFPSVVSREVNFYYGNKRNRFWRILEEFFNENIGENRLQKIQFCLKNNIALWDVAANCSIRGSSDSKIKLDNINPVDLKILLNETPALNNIICNGQKAYSLFQKFFPYCQINCVCLPSTSPANVSFDKYLWIDFLNKAFRKN